MRRRSRNDAAVFTFRGRWVLCRVDLPTILRAYCNRDPRCARSNR